MCKTIKYVGLIMMTLGLGMTSCSEDYPKSSLEAYDTDIFSIRITNAGANQNTVIEGSIDEDEKMINFPRLDAKSNFSSLQFEAELSEGCELKKSVYDFTMPEGVSEKTSIIRLVNNNRYKEYFIKIRKKVPVFGADFEQPKVYNFSGDNIYKEFANASSTRCASFDGQNVLVVTRGVGPHLLKFTDLKQGNSEKILKLNTEGVIGGTFPYNMGALVHGHIYLASLSGSLISPLKIYHWTDPNQKPEIIANINVSEINGALGRHGDNASFNIDEKGNGNIFFGENGGKDFLKIPVKNFTSIDKNEIKAIPSIGDATKMVANVCRIGNTDEYLWGALRVPITLVNESMGEIYRSSIGGESVSPKVIYFNKERYLLVCTAGFGGASKASIALEIYNITRGQTIEEALKLFDEGENHNPIYQYKLGGSGNGVATSQTDFYIEKDEKGNDSKLFVFAARTGSGFAICEFPIKKEIED